MLEIEKFRADLLEREHTRNLEQKASDRVWQAEQKKADRYWHWVGLAIAACFGLLSSGIQAFFAWLTK